MGSNTNTFLKDKRSGQEVKGPAKPKDVIYDTQGQWKYPGQVTKIPSSNITMQGVPYPVYGEDDLGYGQMMYPGMDYMFPGQYVTETPMAMYGGDPSLPNITGHYKTGGWLDEYAPGGEGPPSTLDIIKRRKIQQAMADEAARRKGVVALPDITRVNIPNEQVVETKAKPKATVKGTRIPIKQQAQLKPSYKTEEQRLADEARGNYIENPTVMDYLGQAGYMPLLAMSDPFSMGENLKSLRQSQSDPRLSAAQKFSQGMDIANEAVPGALLNVATEGIGEGLLPSAIRKATGAPNMAKNLFKELPLSAQAQRLDDLKYAQDWAKQYGYKLPDNLQRISQSKSLTDKTIRGLVNRHNTFVRGVSTNWDVIAAEHPEVLEQLTQAGVDWKNNPKAAAEYMATHIPGDTGYGRHGLNPGENAIYISNSMPTAEGYTYGQGYKVKVKRPTDFSEGNRKQWIKQNEFDVTKDFEGSPFGEGMVKNDYRKRIPTSIRDLVMAQGDPNRMNKLQQLVLDAENKALDEYHDFSRKYKNKREQLRINTDPDYRKNTFLWPDEEAKLKNSANLLDKTKLKYYDTMLKLGELRADVKPYMTFFKHTLGDPNTWKSVGENLFSKDLDPFSHYAIKGTPGQRVLEPIQSIEVTPDIWQNTSRAHINTYTPKLSRKQNGGWLDEEYKRGGALKKLSKNTTSKNIKTSVNKLMARNTTLYGDGGKKYYEPNVKPYLKTGGWLDDVK